MLLAVFCTLNAIAANNLVFNFPLKTPHSGVPLANGDLGILIWGNDSTLKITISKNGTWDSRGAKPFPDITFTEVKKLLTSSRFNELKSRFSYSYDTLFGNAIKPTQLAAGRLEIKLIGLSLFNANLDLKTGTVEVWAKNKKSKIEKICTILMAENSHQFVILKHRPKQFSSPKVLPFYETAGQLLPHRGFKQPLYFNQQNVFGFYQPFPADSGQGIACRLSHDSIAVVLFEKSDAVKTKNFGFGKPNPLISDYLTDYYNKVSEISVPDPVLQRMFDLGVYKNSCCIKAQRYGLPITRPLDGMPQPTTLE